MGVSPMSLVGSPRQYLHYIIRTFVRQPDLCIMKRIGVTMSIKRFANELNNGGKLWTLSRIPCLFNLWE